MSIKLYPPYIEGKIAAQTGSCLNIPFEMNRAVGKNDFAYIKAQIKTIATGATIGFVNSVSVSNSIAVFDLEEVVLKIGEYYKIQLAYVASDGTVGYYSTIGVFKYTVQPTIYINQLKNGQTNVPLITYDGFYYSSDQTEQEYSYKFDIYDSENLVYTSGELVHNYETEFDRFSPAFQPLLGKRYKIVYTVFSTNGLEVSAGYYILDRVETQISFPPEGELKAYADSDKGAINLKYINDGRSIQGKFRLLRFSDNECTDFGSFIINKKSVTSIDLYTDYAISQGVEYKYALEQFNENVKSKCLYSNSVIANFEDIFLSDGERTLKVRFDPKVSSFKTVLQESKVNTLGGQYPFFFRNGHSEYKEFPINGLISVLMDDDYFSAKEQSLFEKSTDLTFNNIYIEREFKLEVLNWLNNGKPKLFRSATEGNYIVRLMNNSLTPNDTLGRMLHSFSSQACEIMEYNSQNLASQGLISTLQNFTELSIRQAALTKDNNTLHIASGSTHIMVMGAANTKLTFVFNDNSSLSVSIGTAQIYKLPSLNEKVVVGVTATNLALGETVWVEYDESYQNHYPIIVDGYEVFSITSTEHTAQYSKATTIIDENVNLLLGEATDFNILSLTLTTKKLGTAEKCEVRMRLPGQEETTIIDLSEHILVNNEIETITGFGHITLTCDMFDDGIFKPEELIISDGVLVNIYYSVLNYETREV